MYATRPIQYEQDLNLIFYFTLTEHALKTLSIISYLLFSIFDSPGLYLKKNFIYKGSWSMKLTLFWKVMKTNTFTLTSEHRISI